MGIKKKGNKEDNIINRRCPANRLAESRREREIILKKKDKNSKGIKIGNNGVGIPLGIKSLRI